MLLILKGFTVEGIALIDFFERFKEIQKLQWELFIDYWYVYIVAILLGLGIVIFWVIKK